MIDIKIGGSKSISNRLLIINALYDDVITINNLSTSQDTQLLQKALSAQGDIVDIHHAGTAMRFLTSFYAISNDKNVTLTGSNRMQERPIAILVNALRNLGADIKYLKNEGFPPLQINGENLKGGTIQVDGNISSQYLSALVLIGSKLENGLTIIPKGEIVSLPYLKMTIELQNEVGIPSRFNGKEITVPYVQSIEKQDFFVESDWSSASYFYEAMAILKRGAIQLSYFWAKSTQADEAVVNIYKNNFGVSTVFKDKNICLQPIPEFQYPASIKIDCKEFPDIAQTITVTAAALKIPIELTGLDTLTIKESDRIEALNNELAKFGVNLETTKNSMKIDDYPNNQIPSKTLINTYSDHRMAMAFAPLKFLFDFEIEKPEVVEKSYPEFWDHFERLIQEKN